MSGASWCSRRWLHAWQTFRLARAPRILRSGGNASTYPQVLASPAQRVEAVAVGGLLEQLGACGKTPR